MSQEISSIWEDLEKMRSEFQENFEKQTLNEANSKSETDGIINELREEIEKLKEKLRLSEETCQSEMKEYVKQAVDGLHAKLLQDSIA